MSTAPIPIRLSPGETYAHVIELATTGLPGNTRRSYGTGMLAFLAWLDWRPFNAQSVREWVDVLRREGKSGRTINSRLAAVRRMAQFAEENGDMDTTTAGHVDRIKGVPTRGVRVGKWLSFAEMQVLLNGIDRSTLGGKLDGAIYALLAGCGLRRGEAAALTMENWSFIDGHRALVNLYGKGGRVRSIGVPPWAETLLVEWIAAAGIEDGRILRPCNHGPISGDRLGASSVYRRVVAMADKYLQIHLKAHDLRRSLARAARLMGAELEDVSKMLGHASIETTRIYTALDIDMSKSPSDLVRLEVPK